MRHVYNRLLAIAIVALITLGGCTSPLDRWMPPVRVFQPQAGDTLTPRKPFTIVADINVKYDIQSVQIMLWDVASGAQHIWRLDQPARPRSLRIHQNFIVPATLPPGADYRLSIDAIPDGARSAAFGYTTKVKVGAP